MNTISEGMTVDFKSLSPITQAQLRAYADASGDQNPIHLDENVAKKMGLPGVIAHGMLNAAFLAERALEFMDREPGAWKLREFQSRFKAMTFLGDTVSVGGSVKDANADKVTLQLQAKNQREEVVTTATAMFERV